MNELTNDIDLLKATERSLTPRMKLLNVANFSVIVFQLFFFFVLNLRPIYMLVTFTIVSAVIFTIFFVFVRIALQFVRRYQGVRKKAPLFIDDLERMRGKVSDSMNPQLLKEFITQRSQMGFNTSIKSVQGELDAYGIKVKDSDIIRSHLNLHFSDDPNARRELLSFFDVDGKPHTSFDELSDEKILDFFENIKDNRDSTSTS